ncbi:MAG TPA: hypothetical protein HA282_06045 [Nanoarchaeota archaeon]|nr:MAG: hypothetical protein QT01_C0001G0029 [archaeon GW2011_AR6]HIH17673.1 hypothetical protein [Nanoarchaeota archaeon]HIH33642.1 hypothetical protein [Nanoarchaeota archaeon]HIH51691.1 hypothetical protein [Nanoarchaeota archaeon]HIH66738.1 hypothetical protein [Nanoarchaeota archaeon]
MGKIRKSRVIGLAILIIWSVIVFYFGNFLEDSYFVKETNVFNKLFGVEKVDLDINLDPNIENNITIITGEITNVGDKEIEQPYILFSFCGLPIEKAGFDYQNLLLGEKREFKMEIEEIKLNKTCSTYTKPVKTQIYRSEDFSQCFLEVEEGVSNVCQYCKATFEIYGNSKLIQKEVVWYPYYNGILDVRKVLNWMFSRDISRLRISLKNGPNMTCSSLPTTVDKSSLVRVEPVEFTLSDMKTACIRGDDVEWCMGNFYKK